jgi:hypothetical protein
VISHIVLLVCSNYLSSPSSSEQTDESFTFAPVLHAQSQAEARIRGTWTLIDVEFKNERGSLKFRLTSHRFQQQGLADAPSS